VGVPITFDASARGAHFNINYNALGNRDFPPEPRTLALLPGTYAFCCPASTNPFLFEVRPDGTLDYPAELDAFVSGRGTSTLTVSKV
jgi:hypothetical protein